VVRNYSAAVLGQDDQPWNWQTTTELFETLHALPLGQNVRALLPHNPVRVAAMGFAQRAATEQEITAQEALVEEAMQAGAAGLSLGLMYIPGIYTPTEELIRLARVVGRHGGVIASHMRGEGDRLLSSINEMLTIAEQAEVAVHISHLKITGRKNWGHIDKALNMIADARARGLDITVDVYPYNAGSTTITQLLPPWVQEGGQSSMLERLRDPAIQQRILRDFASGSPGWENQIGANGWESIHLAALHQERYKALEGLNLVEAGTALGMSTEAAFFHLVQEERGQITILLFSMDERDVDQVVESSFSMIGSDGLPIASGRPHPRLYGTFPRFIKRYVRERHSIPLEQAIRKVTALPAERFGLADRGVIAAGNIADLVIFDPDTISDTATYSNPRAYPHGIAAVIVAGQPVLLQGEPQSSLPGQLIAHTPGSAPQAH
ncbi:MAG: amidohydrolase family protein, partial [Ktedonobacteraceae bacterium]|nr:amidohydrolase family protein [Ktedonobacteraceae bacterium]